MSHSRPGPFRVAAARLVLAGAVVAMPMSISTARAEARTGSSAATTAAAAVAFDSAAWAGVELGDIDPDVLALAIEAARSAVSRGDAVAPSTLTIIDFSRPSTEKRLWVYDVRTHALLFDELVSHGRGSGRTMATAFSNEPDSNQSSLGLFRTAEAYVGKNGYSLRLDGLEPGVNDRARERAIVIHGAPYVNGAVAKAQGYLGRSLGCPAVRPEIARPLIDAIKGGGLLFAYYPDHRWLDTSPFLPATP